MESCSTQAVLPLFGLAAEKVIRDRYIFRWNGCSGAAVGATAAPILQPVTQPGSRFQNALVGGIRAVLLGFSN
ncbi:MAG: hypothetical protein ACQESR_07325 [Planctomycetota bacterium]